MEDYSSVVINLGENQSKLLFIYLDPNPIVVN